MPNTNMWGVPNSGHALVSILAAFAGIDNTDTSDSGAGFLSAETGVVETGQAAWLHDGTYKVATAWTTPSHLQMRGGPTVRLHMALAAGAGPAWSQSFFYGPVTYLAGGGGTVNSNAALGAVSISVASVVKPTIGNIARFTDNAGGWTYVIGTITNVTGGASPWTVTIDHPIQFPLTATWEFDELTAVTSNVWVEGFGMVASGTGDAVWEFVSGSSCHVRGVCCDATNGNLVGNGGAVGIFDIGSFGCEASDGEATVGGLTGALWQMQSNTRSAFRRMKGNVGVLLNFTGISCYDSYECGIEDCWVYGPGASVTNWTGIGIGSFGTTPGCVGCWGRGGGVLGAPNGTALVLTYSQDTSWMGFVAEKCLLGVQLAAGTKQARLYDMSVAYCTQGLTAQGGVDCTVYGLDISHCTSSGGYIVDSMDIYDLVGDFAAGESANCINQPGGMGSGNLAVHGGRITSAVVGGSIFNANGSGLTLEDFTGTCTGGGSATVLQLITGTTNIARCTIAGGAAGYAVYMNSGSTLHIGPDCDLSGTHIIGNLGGANTSVTMQQTGGTAKLSSLTGTVPLSFAQNYNTRLECTGALTGNVTYEPLGIPGLTFVVYNNTTNAHTVTILSNIDGGAGVTVAQGKTAIVQVDSTGSVVRVTADT